jgi:heptosyltransferase-1
MSSRRWLREQLQAKRYDLVVDLQGLMKSALVARLAESPVAGYDAKSIRESTASPFYDRKFAVSRDLHAVERNRRLLAAAIGYEVPPTPPVFGLKVDSESVLPDLPERFCLAVHSASWPSKLWSEENWRRLVDRLAGAGLPAVLPWGSDAEKARAERIAAGGRGAFVLPQRLDGAELAATIGKARVAVGLDSGLMHLAAALGVPGIWLFGPTDPGLTGPCSANQTVVRSANPNAPCRTRDCTHGPDGRSCMDMVEFERVAEAVEGR